VAFAPALIYVGSYEIEWKEVAIAATWISWNVKQPPQRGLVNIYSRAGEIFKQRMKRGTFLEEFLAGNLMKYSNATDPRDKIYALLGLMHDSEKNSVLLQPDYSKSVERAYGDVVRQLLRENEEDCATNLTEAFAAIERFDEEQGDFPSWIPRWDDPDPLKDPRYRLDAGLDLGWNASLDRIPEVREVSDAEILVLKSLKVTDVTHVFSLRVKLGDTEWLRNI
jgi:hypothetical protein